MTRRVTVESSPVEWPAIAVHGGAGSYERLADQPGYIGPQGEGGVLEFRNIRIRDLKQEP